MRACRRNGGTAQAAYRDAAGGPPTRRAALEASYDPCQAGATRASGETALRSPSARASQTSLPGARLVLEIGRGLS